MKMLRPDDLRVRLAMGLAIVCTRFASPFAFLGNEIESPWCIAIATWFIQQSSKLTGWVVAHVPPKESS